MLFKVEVAAVHISMLGRFFIQLFLGGALLILESVQAYFILLPFEVYNSKIKTQLLWSNDNAEQDIIKRIV